MSDVFFLEGSVPLPEKIKYRSLKVLSCIFCTPTPWKDLVAEQKKKRGGGPRKCNLDIFR